MACQTLLRPTRAEARHGRLMLTPSCLPSGRSGLRVIAGTIERRAMHVTTQRPVLAECRWETQRRGVLHLQAQGASPHSITRSGILWTTTLRWSWSTGWC